MRVSQEALLPDEPDIWHAASGFGGGIGGCGDVCGAVSGAVIAIGLVERRSGVETDKAPDRIKQRVRKLYDDFAAKFGSMDCRALTGYLLRGAEQYAAFKASDVKKTRCYEYVKLALRHVVDG